MNRPDQTAPQKNQRLKLLSLRIESLPNAIRFDSIRFDKICLFDSILTESIRFDSVANQFDSIRFDSFTVVDAFDSEKQIRIGAMAWVLSAPGAADGPCGLTE